MKKSRILAIVLSLTMAFGLCLPGMAADFADTNGHWGAASISRWAENGVLNGDGSGSFNPNGPMTRAQFAQMLCNLMGYTEKAANTFNDVPAGAWYADAILKLAKVGVMSGNGEGTIAPDDPISREQAAVMLCRALNIKPTGKGDLGAFSDAGNVSSWAKDAVTALVERGMMSGPGGNEFAPAVSINRASVAQMLDNMVSEYVTEDGATVTGEVKGIVIVRADNVKIENATLSEPVIVAPAAADATVSLTGTTSAADVVVAAEGAKVVVAETAAAKSIEVEAPKAGAEIAGKVDSVAVAASASNAAVTVDKSGTVKDVTVSGSGTSVDVSGKVDKVAVTESASKTEVKTEAGAKIESVTAASDVTVSGASGTVGSVTATGESDAKVDVAGAEVRNEGTGNVTAGDKVIAAGESTGGGSSSNNNDSSDSDNDDSHDDTPAAPPAADDNGGGNETPCDHMKDGEPAWDSGKTVEATCKELAKKVYTCSVCNQTKEQVTGSKLGDHTATGYTTSGGFHSQKCTVCDMVFGTAFCEDSNGDGSCNVCGGAMTTSGDDHNWQEDKDKSEAASCVKEGKLVYKCVAEKEGHGDSCGTKETTLSKTNDHTKGEGAGNPAATCTTGGKTEYKCSNCGTLIATETTAPLGHEFGAWTQCNKDTPGSRKCTRGDATEPCTGHDNPTEAQKTPATCTEAALMTYTCKVCGGKWEAAKGQPNGHTESGEAKQEGTDSHWTDSCLDCGAGLGTLEKCPEESESGLCECGRTIKKTGAGTDGLDEVDDG